MVFVMMHHRFSQLNPPNQRQPSEDSCEFDAVPCFAVPANSEVAASGNPTLNGLVERNYQETMFSNPKYVGNVGGRQGTGPGPRD